MINKNKQESVKFYTPHILMNPNISIEVLTPDHHDQIMSVLESFSDVVDTSLANRLYTRKAQVVPNFNKRFMEFYCDSEVLPQGERGKYIKNIYENNGVIKHSILSYSSSRLPNNKITFNLKQYTLNNIIGKDFIVYNDFDQYGNITASGILKLLAFIPNADFPYIVRSSISTPTSNIVDDSKIITTRFKYGFPVEMSPYITFMNDKYENAYILHKRDVKFYIDNFLIKT